MKKNLQVIGYQPDTLCTRKDLQKFDSRYAATRDGRIWSYKNEKFLVPTKTGHRYLYIRLHRNGKTVKYYVHRLVAQTFIPNPSNLPQVNHKDSNKLNNDAENLEWCSNKENIIHSYKTGKRRVTTVRGQRHHAAILTDAQVIAMRTLKARSQITNRKLSKIYGTSESNVSLIIKRLNWAHL